MLVGFLAALLRIADECDTAENRTPEIIYYNLKPEGASEQEFKKHLSITGIGKSAPYKLLISGVARSPKGVQVIEGVKKKLQQQLDSVKTILAQNGILLDLVETQIDTKNFINKPIGFKLDQNAIVKLLIGTAIYSRNDTAIRELLQNCVDTCRIRKVIEADYDPCIEIESNNEAISFEDNGLGMNFEDAFEYLSKKGNSFYVSKDLKSILKNKSFVPISKFGIGILSAFIIADKMTIETKKETCTPCRFTISNIAEGWIYEEGSRQLPGTRITLYLNAEGKKLDIQEALEHYSKDVKIPIMIKIGEMKEKQKLIQKWDYNIKEVRENLENLNGKEIAALKSSKTIKTTSEGVTVIYNFLESPVYVRGKDN